MSRSTDKVTITSEHRLSLLTRDRLILAALVPASLVVALLALLLDFKLTLAVLFFFPALIGAIIIIRYPYAGIFMYWLFDFLRPQDFIPGLSKLRLATVIAVLTLASWLIHVIRHKTRIYWDTPHWLFVGLVAVVAFGVPIAANNKFAYDVFQMLLTYLLIFLVVTNVIEKDRQLDRLIWLLVLVNVYFALKGIENYVLGIHQLSWQRTSGEVGGGYIGDENDFAMAMVITIAFAFFLLLKSRIWWQRMFLAGCIVLYVIAVVVSWSRGGLVGLVGVVGFCVWFSGRRVAGLAGLVLAAGLFFALVPSNYTSEMETITDTQEGTAKARIEYWKAAFRMLADHPILGVGAHNGGVHMPAYINSNNPATSWGRAFHGLIPEVAADLGILGLIFYSAMTFWAFRALNRIRKRIIDSNIQRQSHYLALCVMGGYVAYFVASMFLSTAYYPQFWTLFALTACLVALQSRYERSTPRAAADISSGYAATGQLAGDT